MWRAAECDVSVAHAPAHADRRDPGPWTLDPPAGDVRHGRRRPEPAEPGLQVAVAELHPGIIRPPDAEQPEHGSRSSPETDREPLRGHPGRLAGIVVRCRRRPRRSDSARTPTLTAG